MDVALGMALIFLIASPLCAGDGWLASTSSPLSLNGISFATNNC